MPGWGASVPSGLVATGALPCFVLEADPAINTSRERATPDAGRLARWRSPPLRVRQHPELHGDRVRYRVLRPPLPSLAVQTVRQRFRHCLDPRNPPCACWRQVVATPLGTAWCTDSERNAHAHLTPLLHRGST